MSRLEWYYHWREARKIKSASNDEMSKHCLDFHGTDANLISALIVLINREQYSKKVIEKVTEMGFL